MTPPVALVVDNTRPSASEGPKPRAQRARWIRDGKRSLERLERKVAKTKSLRKAARLTAEIEALTRSIQVWHEDLVEIERGPAT